MVSAAGDEGMSGGSGEDGGGEEGTVASAAGLFGRTGEEASSLDSLDDGMRIGCRRALASVPAAGGASFSLFGDFCKTGCRPE